MLIQKQKHLAEYLNSAFSKWDKNDAGFLKNKTNMGMKIEEKDELNTKT